MSIADTDLGAIRVTVDPELMCGEAVLESFGVRARYSDPGSHCWFGAGLASCLRAAGYQVDPEPTTVRPQITLGRFIAGHPTGDWVIATAGHLMCLRDGRLTDTDERGTSRRRVEFVYRVTRSAP